MSILAEIAVASDVFELGDVLSDGETNTHIDLTQFVPVAAPYFRVLDSDDQEAYERAVRADSRVEELMDSGDGIDRTLYRLEWTEGLDGFMDALRDNAVIVEAARGGAEEWVLSLRADAQQALSAFQNDCFDAEVRLDIRRMVDDTDSAGSDIYGVTSNRSIALRCVPRSERFEISKPESSARVPGYFRNYCEDCGWSASTETHSRSEVAAAALEHARELGHDINSELIADLKDPL